MNKQRLLLLGYAILSVIAIIFLFLAIFADDNQVYIIIGLMGIIFATMLNLLRDSSNKKDRKK